MILFVPGLLNDERVWGDVLSGLRLSRWAAQAGELVVAQVGHGQTIQEMARQASSRVESIRASTGDTTPLIVVGFSMGGYITLEMLVRQREAIHGVVLVGTSAAPEPAGNIPNRERALASFEKDFGKAVAGIASFGTFEAVPEVVDSLRLMMLGIGPEVAARQTRAIMGRPDHRLALAGLAMPIRLVCGEQDRIVAPSQSQAMAQLWPHAQLRVVPQCGHMVPKEKPHEVLVAITDVIAGLMPQSARSPACR
jgi:pimeloyl-ACP methyl ester carboxylesterase